MSAFLYKYATTATVYFPLISVNSVNFTSTASLTTADMKRSIDGAAFATVGTAITNVGSFGYSYSFTTGDLTGKRIIMIIHHTAATPTFEDQSLLIETYGNSAAAHTFDLSIANQTVIASAGTVTLTGGQLVTVGTISAAAVGAGLLSAGAFAAGFFSAGGVAVGALSAGGFAAAFLSAGGIAASAISAGGIATAAITSAKIATGGLDSTNFGAGFLSNGGIATAAISSAKIATGGLDSTNFGAGFISAGGIVAGVITGNGGFPTNFAALSITAVTGLVSISTAATVNIGTIATGAVTSIWANAMVEPTAVPSITTSVLSALSWMFALSRDRIEQTATTQILKQTDGTTTVATATISDDATTFVRGSFN